MVLKDAKVKPLRVVDNTDVGPIDQSEDRRQLYYIASQTSGAASFSRTSGRSGWYLVFFLSNAVICEALSSSTIHPRSSHPKAATHM